MPSKKVIKPPYVPLRIFRVHRKGDTEKLKYGAPRSKTYASGVWALDHLRVLKNDGAQDSELWVGEITWRKMTAAEIKELENDPR